MTNTLRTTELRGSEGNDMFFLEQKSSDIRDIEEASLSSTGFWDNPDEAVWDNIQTGRDYNAKLRT
ncbi:hypothetical protein FACS1894202_04050 [Clostridia bacterium]|nr:hypothetical protein FACS1894202_04050 [Clostridia bacterium]